MELKVHDQEIFLQRLWKSRKLFSEELRTISGERVEVIYAGSENLDTGPDFKDAILKINSKLLKGDVEVHLEPSGWYAHGHHQDSRYNRVVLHVISQAPKDFGFIEREDGVRVPQLLVKADRAKSQLWKASRSSVLNEVTIVENCPLSQCDETRIVGTLNLAGRLRLLEKAERMQEEFSGVSWDQLIYKRVMEALGYSKNVSPFSKLAELVPYEVLVREMQWVPDELAQNRVAALLFGAAGLLPSQSSCRELDSITRAFVTTLESLWNQLSHRLEIKPMKTEAWQFFRLRPQNFPTRRIAGMVQIVHKLHHEGFIGYLTKPLTQQPLDCEKTALELEFVFSIPAQGFWADRYRFTDNEKTMKSGKGLALIGRDRARDVVVNIVLPALLLYAQETQHGALKNAVRELFLGYPKLSENSITKAMRAQLFENKRRPRRAHRLASQQQGMIHLHRNYCRPLRCSECLTLGN
ncbi:DUF2851 family protein [bacterium]|nr:DUF2851 family protein [bacterium]